jgi:hypothetical protein
MSVCQQGARVFDSFQLGVWLNSVHARPEYESLFMGGKQLLLEIEKK